MLLALWIATVVLAFICGGALYGLYLTESGLDDDDRRELGVVRHEVGVILRVLEEAGIQFNRDNDRNVTGVIVDVRANLTAEGALQQTQSQVGVNGG